jgi:hypothetical protein
MGALAKAAASGTGQVHLVPGGARDPTTLSTNRMPSPSIALLAVKSARTAAPRPGTAYRILSKVRARAARSLASLMLSAKQSVCPPTVVPALDCRERSRNSPAGSFNRAVGLVVVEAKQGLYRSALTSHSKRPILVLAALIRAASRPLTVSSLPGGMWMGDQSAVGAPPGSPR